MPSSEIAHACVQSDISLVVSMVSIRLTALSSALWSNCNPPSNLVNVQWLTLSLPIPLRLYTLPYWPNPPLLIFDIPVMSARMSKVD